MHMLHMCVYRAPYIFCLKPKSFLCTAYKLQSLQDVLSGSETLKPFFTLPDTAETSSGKVIQHWLYSTPSYVQQ